ncbi:MAG: hypothetical protein AB8F74_21835 [Saprospiraceae bacterium]
MKKISLRTLFLFLFSLLLFYSCKEKDKGHTLEGNWHVKKSFERTISGISDDSYTSIDSGTLIVESEVSGVLKSANDEDENVEWIRYDDEREIAIFIKRLNPEGDIYYAKMRHFEVLEDEYNYHEWIKKTNELGFTPIERYERWILTPQ